MALKTSNGDVVKKQKVDIAQKIYEDELAKQKDDSRKEVYAMANQNISADVADNKLEKLSITNLYSAPTNSEWNDFKKLNPDELYRLNQTIIDGGLMTPIIVWKINKNELKTLYDGNIDEYGFIGEEYMILAGHSRTYSYVLLNYQTGDEKYSKIDAIVKHDLTFDQARYIIKVTNLVNRELSPKEKRNNIKFLHRTLSENKTKGMNVAKKIAEDSGQSLRAVKYQIAINEKLIQEFIDMYDDEVLSQGSILKITNLTRSLQKWLYDEYGEKITDKILKGLQRSYDKKEQLSKLFERNCDLEYVTVSTEIPKSLENKFRKMIENWKQKNV